MHRVGWRLDEIEMSVKGAHLIVLGVNSEGADACDVGCLQAPQQRVLQQGLSDAPPLVVPIDRKPSQQHDGDTMPRETFGKAPRCCGKGDFTDDQRMIADDAVVVMRT